MIAPAPTRTRSPIVIQHAELRTTEESPELAPMYMRAAGVSVRMVHGHGACRLSDRHELLSTTLSPTVTEEPSAMLMRGRPWTCTVHWHQIPRDESQRRHAPSRVPRIFVLRERIRGKRAASVSDCPTFPAFMPVIDVTVLSPALSNSSSYS